MDLREYATVAQIVVGAVGFAIAVYAVRTDDARADLPIPSAEDCAAWAQTPWYSITYAWYLCLC